MILYESDTPYFLFEKNNAFYFLVGNINKLTENLIVSAFLKFIFILMNI